MPKISLGTCCGSDPKVGLKPWLTAGAAIEGAATIGVDTAWCARPRARAAAQAPRSARQWRHLSLTPQSTGDTSAGWPTSSLLVFFL